MAGQDDDEAALVTIGVEGGFRAAINPLGAELWWLRDASGRDLLWDGDPAFWTGRAPVLFPIVGALRDDRYAWQGAWYSLARHGFARRMPWRLTTHDAVSARFRLEADAATRAVYPFDFVLDLAFAVSIAGLTMTAEVGNAGDDVMPFSFGFHPALRWPFAAGQGREDCRLRFDHDEPGDIAQLDAAGLVARRVASPLVGRELPLADALFTDDALILDGLRSRGLEFGAAGGEQLRIDWPGFPDLGIWTKPGAGYLCIEPWQGHADPVDASGDVFAKPGIVVLSPGQRWQGTMTIALGGAADRPEPIPA